jgi:hypothetical protein
VRWYFLTVDLILIKYKVPTKAIQAKVKELADQLQLTLSHVEHLSGKTKAEKSHAAEAKAAMKKAATIMHQIQNLAAIVLDSEPTK